MPSLYFPDDFSDAMSTCALRFDVYKYAECSGLSGPDGTWEEWPRLMEPVVKTLTLQADDNMNFAAFFGLQRYLHKWGGEFFTKYSDEHIAYDFLFLHLYDHDVPDEFGNPEYCIRWQLEFEGRKEAIAGFVRNSFHLLAPKTNG